MFKFRGLATGIGSLPYADAQKAVESVFKYLPKIPFWPQLPKKDIREEMVAQFSENFPCLRLTEKGLSYAQDSAGLERFYEHIISRDRDYFAISREYACGLYALEDKLQGADLESIDFLKCQITGPFTFGASIKDETGRALLHNQEYMQVIVAGLAAKALWQIKFFKKFGKKIIIFIDEPYLACFGSAYAPLSKQEAVRVLRELSEAVKEESDCLIGVHCCGNTDWSIFTEIETIDIINFDAYGFQDRLFLYAKELNHFFERNGVLCWGIVPTQDFSGRETAQLLKERLENGINVLVGKGLEKEKVLDNLIISPACGLGTLDAIRTENILQLLRETSALLNCQK